ncbi:hypothetical protein GCM10025870_10510 [Agromyces marinus]|uniref:Uncharacterized protein n=1 Tax=Agromyces marinus TaxID=1389020 RepID=A0ABN6YF04_9MICO|nr:hypothetical protein GCM10025870_10510 [Agromyces marinus]
MTSTLAMTSLPARRTPQRYPRGPDRTTAESCWRGTDRARQNGRTTNGGAHVDRIGAVGAIFAIIAIGGVGLAACLWEFARSPRE